MVIAGLKSGAVTRRLVLVQWVGKLSGMASGTHGSFQDELWLTMGERTLEGVVSNGSGYTQC